MIVDAFTFLNEKELVELRIKYLNELVDCFLIVEADVIYVKNRRKYHKTIVAEKEYKVADCQPSCPLFTSFIWKL